MRPLSKATGESPSKGTLGTPMKSLELKNRVRIPDAHDRR